MSVSYEDFKRGLESGEGLKFNLPEHINSYTRSVVERIGQEAIKRVAEIYEAEINRLKSGQVRLRGYNEITESHHKKVVLALTSTNHWEELTVHYAKNEFEGTSIGGYYDGGYIMGWIDLSDLPTEIEVTA